MAHRRTGEGLGGEGEVVAEGDALVPVAGHLGEQLGDRSVVQQLGIGLDVDEQSRAGERLWALGPLTKGHSWEIIAVPDIREQAAQVADDIAAELGQ